MIRNDFEAAAERIAELIEKKDFRSVRAELEDEFPQDIAELFAGLDRKVLPVVFRLLPTDLAAEVFVEMPAEVEEFLLNSFSDSEIKEVMDELFLDDAVDVIEDMPANVVKRIINQADPETRKMINEILRYPENSAGTIMTVEYVSLKKDWTVRQCFERIRREAVDKETVYNCYVTDPTRKLIGCVSVRNLLLQPEDAVLADFMETHVVAVNVNDDREEVAGVITKYDLSAVPVTDREGRIVGIITVDDVIDVIRKETDEDIAKMAAVTPSDKPYLSQSVFSIWKSRIPWLLLMMVSATFIGLIINTYESTLNALSTLLFACVPMLMDTGGNAGSQASVTVIRSLAVSEIAPRDFLRVIWKEIRVSVMLAACVSLACFAKLQLIDRLLFGFEYTAVLSAVVSGAMFVTLVIAKIVGGTMPLLAKKLRLDPAVVASPFITTIVDALSLILFCNIAVAVLS